MSGKRIIRRVAFGAFCASLTIASYQAHAQSSSAPAPADTPGANEKHWTPERMERAKPLMPSPKVDPRKDSQDMQPPQNGRSPHAPDSTPADEHKTGVPPR